MPRGGGTAASARISSQTSRHEIIRKLRVYGTGAVVCAFTVALLFAIQAFSTPYPLPVSLTILTAAFLVIVAVIHLFLTRQRWCEIRDAGLLCQAPFGRPRLIKWERMRDVRYFAGVAVPFSVKVAGQRGSLLLGVHHPDLPAWTHECMQRMSLDASCGGPLSTIRRPWLFWIGACTMSAALLASPVAVLRALYGAPALALWVLAIGGLAGALAAVLRQPLRWSAVGVTIGRGRRKRHFAWHEVHGVWRRTWTGATGLDLHVPSGLPVRVALGGWGGPRFVAQLGTPPPASAATTRVGVSTGALFPVMLAVFTVVVGLQAKESARLFSELSLERLRAHAGVQTEAQLVYAQRNDRGIHVRYIFEADGQQYRGQGWLLPTALAHIRARPFIPVRYTPDTPQVSVPTGEPTVYYALYYALFALFHAIFVIPLLALWNVTPAPAPFTVPGFAA